MWGEPHFKDVAVIREALAVGFASPLPTVARKPPFPWKKQPALFNTNHTGGIPTPCEGAFLQRVSSYLSEGLWVRP